MSSACRLDHLAIHARDIDASVRFYTEFLSLAEIENPMGPARRIRWFDIAPGIALHLLPDNPEPLPERAINTHIALSATDFDGTVARLTKAGVAFGELPSRPGKITTRPDGVRQCFVQDPDNYWVEVNDGSHR